MAEKAQDPRLGQIGGTDTKVCAITGHEVSDGMQRFALRDGWYFRVKSSRIRAVDEAFIAKMQALIPGVEKLRKDEVKS